MSINKIYISMLFFVIAIYASPGTAITLENLFEQPLIKEIKLSPSGQYLAIKMFNNGVHVVRFIDVKTGEVQGGLSYGDSHEVGNFYWANDERIVAEVLEVGKRQEAPIYYGELFAINFDGTRAEFIFGARSGERQVGSHIRRKTADYAWADLIDVLPDNPKYILISSTDMSPDHDKRPVAKLLNIYNGLEGNTKALSKHSGGRFYTDKNGEIRLIRSLLEDGSLHIEALPKNSEEWVEIPESKFGEYFTPLAISDDLDYAYVLDNYKKDKVGLYKLSLDGSSYEEFYTNDAVDITDVTFSADGKSIYAMRVDKNYPSYLVLPNAHEEAIVFKQLLQTFSGNMLDITSRSRDGKYWTVYVSTDTDAGSFYLYNHEESSIKLLFKARPELASKELAIVEPIEFETFDRIKISGYFTGAINTEEKIAPLVVLLHGGPQARDYWGYDPEVQALATNGYSVLQVNYRGSNGYGKDFLNAGNHHWGDLIQKDIIAATQWAIEQKKAQSGKICIMGASFGAYSAVQSAILAPELYSCVVANAGIYDLALMYKEGDIEEHYTGEAYLERVIGRNKEELKQFSPVYNVGNLKAPVLIAHGKQDERAPYEHAERLKEALDKNDKPYRWFIKDKEAHGFYDSQNQIEYMKEVLGFLKENLGQ